MFYCFTPFVSFRACEDSTPKPTASQHTLGWTALSCDFLVALPVLCWVNWPLQLTVFVLFSSQVLIIYPLSSKRVLYVGTPGKLTSWALLQDASMSLYHEKDAGRSDPEKGDESLYSRVGR